jgi:SAM-dependent methyltransferase
VDGTEGRCQEEIQEAEYRFPYHHVPEFGRSFTQHFVWTWGLNYSCSLELILGELEGESFSSFVDIGCGDGRLVREVAGRFPGVRTLGIDLSARAIALSRAMSECGEFVRDDICTRDPGNAFDAGALIEVIEHLPPDRLEPFLSACSRWIRPGGLLLLTTPHSNLAVPPKHYQHFTVGRLATLLDPWFIVEKTVFLEPKASRYCRLLTGLLCNRLFVLNWRRGQYWIYRRFRERCFIVCEEKRCARIFLRLRRRDGADQEA